MMFSEWSPLYEEILSDMGYSKSADETSARLLKTLMPNADLITDDELSPLFSGTASVFGAAACLEDDINKGNIKGTTISAGSATERVMDMGILPDVVVTDLDGNVKSQIEASRMGSVTLIHAHGDNTDALMKYCKDFEGKVILTTQSKPDNLLRNYGGFTDGDRAVCLARHFGCHEIRLYGFDFENPYPKDGSDPIIKAKKLQWARRIIGDSPDIVISP